MPYPPLPSDIPITEPTNIIAIGIGAVGKTIPIASKKFFNVSEENTNNVKEHDKITEKASKGVRGNNLRPIVCITFGLAIKKPRQIIIPIPPITERL